MTESLKQPAPKQAGSARARLLSGIPLTEHTLHLAGVATGVLEGGDGPPIVLLHGPSEYGAKWLRVFPELVKSYHVIAPDLPGHGESYVPGGAIEADQILAWLGALIERTCASPPVLIAQLSRLVLVDALGLPPFQPAPEFGHALGAFMAEPTGETHDGLWRLCAFDLDRLRDRMGSSWDRIKAYNLDRACTATLRATQQSVMEQFGFPAIPQTELERIAVPTTLIWGRHDLATRLSVAEAVSERYGWPLHVIEDAADDPPIEQPEAFLKALDAALHRPLPSKQRCCE